MKIKISKIFRFRRRANRRYKDELFRFIFHDKRDLLSLYNAVNGTDYKNPDDLEINTLENVIYLKMKNDLSFLVGASMNLYEHQSTWNPNMPLRGLLYFAELYERYINARGYRLSGNTRIPLPFPNYIVFYNGLEKEAEQMELRLSEAFEAGKEGAEPALECRALILNINSGHNRELMEKCRRLQEYAEFISEIRKNLQRGMVLEKALGQAIEYSLEHGILTDILRRSQAEVRRMLLEEYDEKAEREYLRKEAIEEGWKEGHRKGWKEGQKEGVEAGMKLGGFEILASLIEDGILSVEQAANRANGKQEEFILWYQERKKQKK